MSHEFSRDASANANNAKNIKLQANEIAKQLVSEVSRMIEWGFYSPETYKGLMI